LQLTIETISLRYAKSAPGTVFDPEVFIHVKVGVAGIPEPDHPDTGFSTSPSIQKSGLVEFVHMNSLVSAPSDEIMALMKKFTFAVL
jgi:hypothetical protein